MTEINHTAMQSLLRGMLVGAAQMMESVEAWTEHLSLNGRSLLAQRFMDQLQAEWFPADAPDERGEQIAAQVKHHLASWHAGWPHLWAHIRRVTGNMLMLAPEAGVDPALAYLTGICHDVAKLDETEFSPSHEELGAKFAGRVLEKRIHPQEIEAIQAAIRKRGNGALTRLLHDADKLDKIGAVGVLRRISTDTNPAWIPSALQRVKDDLNDFPSMHFAQTLAEDKRQFLEWFLPRAAN